MKAIPPPAASPTSSTVRGGGLIALEICESLSPSARSRAVVATCRWAAWSSEVSVSDGSVRTIRVRSTTAASTSSSSTAVRASVSPATSLGVTSASKASA